MRILTVRQPWAWAIIHGGKDVENRSRNIAGDYRGPVAIHVGLADADDSAEQVWLDHAKWYRSRARDGGATSTEVWDAPYRSRGHIIGVVDLVNVHNSTNAANQHPTCWGVGERIMDRGIGYCSPWAESGAIHLELANPRPLSTPIPYKGALGLRNVPADVEARIWAEVAA